MSYPKRHKQDYEESWEEIHVTHTACPVAVESFSTEAIARFNRLLISKGAIGVWWDHPRIQEELRQTYVPTKAINHADVKYEDSSMGIALHHLGITFDKYGRKFFPDISEQETMQHSALKIHARVALRLDGYTTCVRLLGWGEKRKLLKLHNISFNASEVELFSGAKSLINNMKRGHGK